MNATTSLAVPPAEQPVAVVVPPDRALNSQQLKNLERIIQSDFSDLRERVNYEITQQLARKQDEIEKQYDATKAMAAARVKAEAAIKKANDILEKAYDAIDGAGGLSFSQEKRHVIRAGLDLGGLVTEGRMEALTKVSTAAERLRQTSSLIIGRRERETERKVLLASVTTTAAAELINGFPKAEDIIAEVTTAVAEHHQDELTALGMS